MAGYMSEDDDAQLQPEIHDSEPDEPSRYTSSPDQSDFPVIERSHGVYKQLHMHLPPRDLSETREMDI
jgi:hypothetical protein